LCLHLVTPPKCKHRTEITNDFTVMSEYHDVFERLGCSEGEHHIEIDIFIKSVSQAPRRVLHILQDRVKVEL
jgi:hypothetical protein